MKIDILTLSHFSHLNIQAPRGHRNAGGGMASLMNSALGLLSQSYTAKICNHIKDLTADVVIVDPLYVTNKEREGLHFEESVQKGLQEIEESKKKNRRHLLWCAEKTVLRFKPKDRQKLLDNVDIIAVTDPYIWQLFKTINVTPHGILCDAINTSLFRPAPKEMIVTAVGGLKYIKNTDFIIEVFRQLEGKIKRTYLGSAVLWSHESRDEDLALINRIQAVTETYYANASIAEVAYHNSSAAIAVNDTWHDCSSRANEELLASGVISIHGSHPLFKGRPGFTAKHPNQAVRIISQLTDNFKRLPNPELHTEARNWALEHVSEQVFLDQFQKLIRWLV